MRILTLSLAFCVAFAGLGAVQEGEKVAIEWKFKKGDSFRYEMTMTSDMSMGGMEIATEMLMGQAFEVTDVSADGVGSLKITYDRMKFKMDGPMAADFDSDAGKKGEDLFGSIFGAMVGKSLTMQMNKKGEISKIEGMKQLMDDIVKSLPEDQQAMAGMFKEQMSDDYVKSMAQNSFGFLPKAPVGKGETWEFATKTVVAGLGKADLSGKSTLKEIRDGKEAVISQDSKLEFKGEDGAAGPMGAAEISPTRTKGEMVWLLSEGRMKSSKSTATMEFTAGGAEASMTMKMEMKLAPRTGAPVKTESGKEAPKETPKETPK